MLIVTFPFQHCRVSRREGLALPFLCLFIFFLAFSHPFSREAFVVGEHVVLCCVQHRRVCRKENFILEGKTCRSPETDGWESFLRHCFSQFLLPINHSGLLNARIKCGFRLGVPHGWERSTCHPQRAGLHQADALPFVILQLLAFLGCY